MTSLSSACSAPDLGKEPAQHLGAQSLLAATIGLMSLSAPINRSNAFPEAQDDMAVDRRSASERITNRAAVAVLPPARPYVSSRACKEAEAPPPTPASMPKHPARDSIKRVIGTKKFPETLFEVISSEQYPDIISWLPHGRGFVIFDKEHFTSAILPRHFDGAKFSSFTRRMKRWNFSRVPRGPEMGAYYHKNFARDQPELVQEMRYGAGNKQESRKWKKKAKQDEKAAENKMVRTSLSKEVIYAAPKNEPLGLPREDKCFIPQGPSENIPGPKMNNTWHSINPQERPMPLSSTLAQNKNPEPATTQKKMAIDTMRHRVKNAKESANIHTNTEWPENQAHLGRSSSFPPRHPISKTPLDPQQRRIAEIVQELRLARSALSQQVANYVSSSGPIGAAGTRSVADGRASNHRPRHASAIMDARRLIEMEGVKRILEAEIVMEHCNLRSHAPALSSNCIRIFDSNGSDNRSCDITAPEIQASSEIPRDAIMDAVVYDLQLRSKSALIPLLECFPRPSINSGRRRAEPLGGSGPVMMSRKEEEELARYMY